MHPSSSKGRDRAGRRANHSALTLRTTLRQYRPRRAGARTQP